jgi:hypothetical protein
MKRLLLVAVAVLLFAPAAQAKGPVQVCGATGCADFATETAVPAELFDGSASATLPAVGPAPYYTIRFQDFQGSVAYWVPSASALRLLSGGSPRWVAASPGLASALTSATHGLAPLAPPTHPRVYLDFDLVKRSAGWLRLYTIGDPVAASPSVQWLSIWMPSGQSPWDGSDWLWISRTGSLLKRDGQVFRIPLATAKKIRAKQPLG